MSNDIFLKYKDKILFENHRSIEECFKQFDKDGDGVLSELEFQNLLSNLFSSNGNPYYLSNIKFNKIFKKFDENKTGRIEFNEFENFWFKAIKPILFSRSALIIVDVQNDFISGTLALRNCQANEEGAEVVDIVNELITKVPFDLVVYTQDWHPEDHVSFYENYKIRKLSENSPIKNNIKLNDTVIFEGDRDIEQKLWPAHCIQNTDGADFHPDLKLLDDKNRTLVIQKGTNSDIDSYSAFFDNCKLTKTKLDEELRKRAITDLYICGLATDVCVAATAYDGLELKYQIVIVENACKGVDFDDIQRTKKDLTEKGAIITTSKQISRMITQEDRRPELGYAKIIT